MMKINRDVRNRPGYHYHDAELNCSHQYLLPAVLDIVNAPEWTKERKRVFDLGCGNGAVMREMARRDWAATGVDPSEEGVAHARQKSPELNIAVGSAYDDLASRFGRFPLVLCLEVIEHVYFPRQLVACIHALLEDGGTAILSTPYHGYWKNLTIALLGKMDAHWGSLTDHGHIKFWSIPTMSAILREGGFTDVRFLRVGRIPALAKSMIAVVKR
jgi:2-polyprenyl-3-methyl-5-hydroxy-6-metoxy-1,4-benzoquinol methylase